MTEIVSGWGRTNPVTVSAVSPRDRAAVQQLIVDRAGASQALLARGLGRSYGDAAQLADETLVRLDRFQTAQWIDRDQGILRVGAGVPLARLIDRFVPHGWFVPVSPGTRNVTVGGAIAADIHGKNHHRDGSWCTFVDDITMVVADGTVVVASPQANPGLFWATCGGMGLTGIIVEATIRMAPIGSSTVDVETRRTETLPELMDIMEASDDEHRFSVAWVDLLHRTGRGVLTQGDFAPAGSSRAPGTPAAAIPELPTPRLVQRPFLKVLNEAWFRKAPAEPTVTGESITAFFHPLDAVSNWNRVYGPAGFLQWQIALPDDGRSLMLSVAEELYRHKAPAYFAVLKRFGRGIPAPLSFPMKGWTLAVDFPAGNDRTNALLDELDRQVVDAGGRIYLAKDSRMSPDLLERMYPRLAEWRRARDAWDPDRLFASDLARRLDL